MINFLKKIPFIYSAGLRLKHSNWAIKTRKAINEYLNNTSVPKLQLGAGMNELPGWFNTDYFVRPNIYFLDVTKRFPFPDNTFEFVFSEHHIEHIQYKQARFMLNEVFRVTKPGGYIKINTPNLQKYLYSYSEGQLQSTVIEEHVKYWIYEGFAYAKNYKPANERYETHFINDIFLNYEHRFIYDAQALQIILEEAGFINVIQREHVSQQPVEFQNIESHFSDFDKIFTLYMQGQKPIG